MRNPFSAAGRTIVRNNVVRVEQASVGQRVGFPDWEAVGLPDLEALKKLLRGRAASRGEVRPEKRRTSVDLSGLARIERAQTSWEWPIAAYLYMAGMGAGAFAVGVLAYWLLRPDLPSFGLLLWGPLLVAAGAPFLILDLGKKTRFLNAGLNPRTSWAARGFAILSMLMVSGLVSFLLAVLPDLLPLVGIAVPAWLSHQPVIAGIAQSVALLLALGTTAYTGVFLKSVRYVPLWNTWLLPLLFVFSALSTGAMALVAVLAGFAAVTGHSGALLLSQTLLPIEMVLIVLEGGALAWLASSLRRGGRVAARKVKHLLVKSVPGLAVGLGCLAAAALYPGLYFALLLPGAVVVLAGGFMLRLDVVKGGRKEAHPMSRMAPLQYNWKALAVPSGLLDRAEQDQR